MGYHAFSPREQPQKLEIAIQNQVLAMKLLQGREMIGKVLQLSWRYQRRDMATVIYLL
jgi:hypothetical protein